MQGFGEVERKVKKIRRIVYTTLTIMILLVVASIYSISQAVEENGGVHKSLVKMIREAKSIEQEASQPVKQ